jgi:hypothetical protein
MGARRYRLDHKPSDLMRRLLRRLADGYQVTLFPGGAYRVRQTDEPVLKQTLQACWRRQWITSMPGCPLFDDACRLTPRGLAALSRQVKRELAAGHVT